MQRRTTNYAEKYIKNVYHVATIIIFITIYKVTRNYVGEFFSKEISAVTVAFLYYFVVMPLMVFVLTVVFIFVERDLEIGYFKLNRGSLLISGVFIVLYIIIYGPIVTMKTFDSICISNIAIFFIAEETRQISQFLILFMGSFFFINGLIQKCKVER